jgi:hypothetical protein
MGNVHGKNALNLMLFLVVCRCLYVMLMTLRFLAGCLDWHLMQLKL